MKLTESDVQKYVINSFNNAGWLVVITHDSWHRPVHDGIADLLAIKNGLHAWIETKAPDWKECSDPAKMSKREHNQAVFAAAIREAGGLYMRVQTTEEADRALRRLLKELDRRAEKR